MKKWPRYLPGSLLAFLFGFLPLLSAQEKAPCDLPHFSADVEALQKAAAAITAKPGSEGIILCDYTSYLFDAGGKQVRTSYVSYKILSEKGAQDWDELVVHWEPWHEEKPNVRVRVISADGAIHPLDPKTVKEETASDEERKVYLDGRVLRAPLPAIASGAIVEQEVVSSDKAAEFPAGSVARSLFGSSARIEDTRLILEAPISVKLAYETQMLPNVKMERTEAEGRVRVSFVQGALEALDDVVPNLPNDLPGRPGVTFSTGKDWQGVASNYASIVDKQIAGADLKAEVARITRGKAPREEKIGALLDYLSQEIRYTGVEFGEAAIVPHSPAETLKHKYGDCKDKSSLMVAMLRTAGIPAYVALLKVGSRQEVSASLPGMGMFDHAIVYVPGSPEYWIDVTDQYARLGQLPSADQGRLALVARSETSTLTRIPESPSADNLMLEKREIFLAENGPSRVVETTEPHGIYESGYRSFYADANDKDLRKNLTEYVRNMYLAEKLVRMERSDPKDLAKQFQLVLEAGKAKRGVTDLDNAAAAIRVEALFERLPNDLQQREKEAKKEDAADDAPKKPRTEDYQLPAAFVTEWRYRIVPPVGFQAKELPPRKKEAVGPATFEQEFSLIKEGVVEAVLRFDTVKRRLTAEESKQLQNAVAGLRDREPLVILFEPVALGLRNQGKVKESLQATRQFIALHPNEGLHHLQLAKTLLEAGMGEAAREEARQAVKLEPNSALAGKTLAEILEYDVVGRKFRPGSDYAGAEEAFRTAVKLDPEDKVTVANLAILLEYNRWGLRYGRGGKLKEALAEYRKLKTEELAGFGLENNLAFALFYAGEFLEAQKVAQTLNPQPAALLIACETALKGAQAGLAEAKKRSSGEEQYRQSAKVAGQMLENLRMYTPAADLLEAGASGENASDTAADALTLRKTQPREQIVFPDDPSGMAMRLCILQMEPDVTVEQLRKISSRNGLTTLATPEAVKQYVKNERGVYSSKARTGVFADVGVDMAVARTQPKAEGSDATGYKVTLWGSASYKEATYVVREEGQYKVLATSRNRAGAALEVLDRLSANDVTGARVLLDWLREDEHLTGDDDPLAGGAFPRLWTKGKNADASTMKLAAAAILTEREETAQRGMAVLENAKVATLSNTEKLGFAIALFRGYSRLEDYKKALAVSSDLYAQFPESQRAFAFEALDLRALGRFQEAEQLVQERLERMPGDVDARRHKASNAIARGQYEEAHTIEEKIVSDGKSESTDLNSIAWDALFTGRIAASDIEAAIKGAQLSSNSAGILHTLGCVYAEVGKTKEAREVLVQAMDKMDLDEPDDDFWYAFGRIAEQYGELKSAVHDYNRVEKPKRAVEIPTSSYRLAQLRLAAMEKSATPAGH
jgi:transglutaminase-like putative cysteine protease/Flp pilus assembly protein TadD